MLPADIARIKAKVCTAPGCDREFLPHRPMQQVCSQRCAMKKVRAEKSADRAKTRQRKEAAKPRQKLKSEAQDAFNEFIRYRDRFQPCVSCGIEDPPMTSGGQWDAGHFLSRGSHPELAFDEDNCHKQCKRCNAGGGRFKHKERTVSARFEEELIRRIGVERVESLQGPHEPAKRTQDDFRALRDYYRARLKELKSEAALPANN